MPCDNGAGVPTKPRIVIRQLNVHIERLYPGNFTLSFSRVTLEYFRIYHGRMMTRAVEKEKFNVNTPRRFDSENRVTCIVKLISRLSNDFNATYLIYPYPS